MTRPSWKYSAFICVLVWLVLSASVSMAQGRGKFLGLKGTPIAASGTQGATGALHDPQEVIGAPGAGASALIPDGSSSYTFSYLDYPQAPYTGTWGINYGAKTSKIEVTGAYGPELGSGLLLQLEGKKDTTYTFNPITFPGSSSQLTEQANDKGQVVGEYTDSQGFEQGYEYSGGKFIKIAVPFAGAIETIPGCIDNAGEIVGYWYDSSSVAHGFLLAGGSYSSFDYPGAAETIGQCLNNKVDIVGFYLDTAGNWHGFLLTGGDFISIDVPGSLLTWAVGINDNGDIVGSYCATSQCASEWTGFQGFLLSGEAFTTINVPGATTTELDDINDKGVIVGGYVDARGGPGGSSPAHGFLAFP